jgi:glucan 1,3-beta-glucosidase
VTGIELLNEPFASVDLSFIQAFYLAGYPLVRPQSSAPAGEGLDLYIHDAFRLGSWGGFMQPPEFQQVYLDTHLYHVFDRGLLQMSQQQHLDFQCTQVAAQQAQAAKNLWLVTGEWSLATTDCAKCK